MSLFRSTLKPTFSLLSKEQKNKSVLLTLFMVLHALLEFINLGLFIPLFGLIANPDAVISLTWLPFDLSKWPFIELVLLSTLALLIFSVAKYIISVRFTRTKAKFAYGVAQQISLRILNEQLSMPYAKFVKIDFSEEINRSAHVPVAFATNVLLALATLVSEGLIALLIVAGIAIYNYAILISLLVILAPVAYSYIHERKKIKKISVDLKSKHPELLKSSLSPLEAWLEIKTTQAENFFKSRFKNIQSSLMGVFAEENAIQTNVVKMTELFAAVIICFIILWALVFEKEYGQTLILLGIYVGASFRLLPSINRILNALVQIKTHQHVIDELKLEKEDGLEVSGKLILFEQQIRVTNLFFAYEKREPLFENLDLEIKKGEKVAIIGKSGNGKSTLLLILIGILRTKGKILIDNFELENRLLPSYQRLFSYTSQNPYLVDGTIEQNIAFGLFPGQIDKAKLWRTIEQVDLGEFVKRLPLQEQTPIYEKGVTLSGGQRQRLALARALYSDREILIFDEVTNQLDSETERKVAESLQKIALQNKTILMVTHHPQLLKLFDRVLKLENGRLEEVTNH